MKNNKVLIAVVAAVVVIAVVLGVVLLGGGSANQEYKLGMGAVAGDHNASQTNLTVATVVTDANGKILACRIDVAQNKYSVVEGEVTFSNLKTKMELGDAYGMAGKVDNNGDGVKLEWYEQVKAFEKYVVGKTGAEVAAMTTQVANNHNISTDDALLNAGCTIDIVDLRDAVVKACNDEQGMTFAAVDSFKLGLGINSANDGSAADDEENYTIKLNVEFAASVVVDGKIVATVNDAYQPNITVEDGDVVSATVGTFAGKADKNNTFMTKRELKETYGMKVAAIDKNGDGKSDEWYIQSAAYSAHVVGKTGSEVAGLFTAGDDLLSAGCTIYIGGISTVVAESVTNAR